MTKFFKPRLVNPKKYRPDIKFDGRLVSDNEKFLSQEVKNYIDESNYVQKFHLDSIDAIFKTLEITKGDPKDAKSIFLKTLEEIFDSYVELLQSGSTPDRAKFILMQSLRLTLTKQFLGEIKNEPTNTDKT